MENRILEFDRVEYKKYGTSKIFILNGIYKPKEEDFRIIEN